MSFCCAGIGPVVFWDLVWAPCVLNTCTLLPRLVLSQNRNVLQGHAVCNNFMRCFFFFSEHPSPVLMALLFLSMLRFSGGTSCEKSERKSSAAVGCSDLTEKRTLGGGKSFPLAFLAVGKYSWRNQSLSWSRKQAWWDLMERQIGQDSRLGKSHPGEAGAQGQGVFPSRSASVGAVRPRQREAPQELRVGCSEVSRTRSWCTW